MALRFRRGTQAERDDVSFIPESGEPVWTTDTQKLYIGDGTTSGGVLVTGASGGGSTPGIDDNSSVVVLTLDNFTSTFTNDVEIDGADLVMSGGSITGTTSINILGNITGSGTIAGNIANLGSLNVTAGISAGGVINAPLFAGDHLGSVFADDSSVIIDAINRTISINQIQPLGGIDIINQIPAQSTTVNLQTDDLASDLRFIYNSSSDLSTETDPFGIITFNRNDPINNNVSAAYIAGGNYALYFGVEETGNQLEANTLTWTNEGKLGVGKYLPTVELDVVGDAVISGSLTAGAMLLSGSNIDTSDSSAITVTPAVTFSSDVTVENNLTVTNTLTVDTLAVTNFQTSGSGTPELASDTDILLTAGTRVEITQSPLKMASFTTTERNALTPQNGDVIYNSTDSKFQGYAGGTWVNLH